MTKAKKVVIKSLKLVTEALTVEEQVLLTHYRKVTKAYAAVEASRELANNLDDARSALFDFIDENSEVNDDDDDDWN